MSLPMQTLAAGTYLRIKKTGEIVSYAPPAGGRTVSLETRMGSVPAVYVIRATGEVMLYLIEELELTD